MEAESVKIIINLIRNYPEIYAVKHADYKNVYKKELAWKNIQEKTGIDVITLKRKWRNLKDTYRKYKQCHQESSRQAIMKLANWVWADEMSFIDSSINVRTTDSALDSRGMRLNTTTSNISIANPTESEEVEIIEKENNEQNEVPIVQSPTLEAAEINRRRAVKFKKQASEMDSADKVINYLKKEEGSRRRNACKIATENVVKVPCDRTDMEFLGYAHTVKRFSLRSQALVKLQITKILTRVQLQELKDSRPNSSFSDAIYNIDDDSNMSANQSTDLPPYFIDSEQIRTSDVQTHSVSTVNKTDFQIIQNDAFNWKAKFPKKLSRREKRFETVRQLTSAASPRPDSEDLDMCCVEIKKEIEEENSSGTDDNKFNKIDDVEGDVDHHIEEDAVDHLGGE